MKKLMYGLLIAAISFGVFAPTISAKAQSTKLVTKTITGADTITFTNVPSKIRAFQYTYTETSGTTAGKVYMYGTITGAYVVLDSLSLSDVATAQTKVFTIAPTAGTAYLSYRFINTNTSSATGSVKAAYLRRTDE